MADSTDALLEIVNELTTTHAVRFAPGTLTACRDIFERTVGNFAHQAADQALPGHPWDDGEFRSFILGQVRRVAEEANTHAAGGPVPPEVFRRAAYDVMKRTQRVCRLAAEQGRLKFRTAPAGDGYEGELCTLYLQDPPPPAP